MGIYEEVERNLEDESELRESDLEHDLKDENVTLTL